MTAPVREDADRRERFASDALWRAARRAWPDAAGLSELPFPRFWRAAVEWIAFNVPFVAAALLYRIAEDAVGEAVAAERDGRVPEAWEVPEKVREICARAEVAGLSVQTRDNSEAWEHAAERAAEVRRKFADGRTPRAGVFQGRLW